jgi:hypothetical protein
MSEELLIQVAQGKDDFDWMDLRAIVLSRLGHESPAAASPASTVAQPRNRVETRDEIREYLLDMIANMNSPPVGIQRLCELVINNEEDPKFYFALERVLSSAKVVRRIKRTDASPSSVYSVSPAQRRQLNRPFRPNRFSI